MATVESCSTGEKNVKAPVLAEPSLAKPLISHFKHLNCTIDEMGLISHR